MSLPRYIDPRKFAQQGIAVEGCVAVAELTRLATALADEGGKIDANLSFDLDEQGHRVLNGQIQAELNVQCQRCMEPMPITVEAELSLAVVWDEEQAEKLPSHLEPWIAVEGNNDIYAVVEEELLLSLPFVAYHEDNCVAQTEFGDVDTEQQEDSKPNPFKVLEQLKGSLK